MGIAGLGVEDYRLGVCIGNRPPMSKYQSLKSMRAMRPGEVQNIILETGNHWRKIFSLYAKLIFALHLGSEKRWQDYRDESLLTAGSREALIFSDKEAILSRLCPAQALPSSDPRIHIITGKHYADSLGIGELFEWIDSDFAVSRQYKMIVSPYFDYRQLSNVKLGILADLVNSLKGDVND